MTVTALLIGLFAFIFSAILTGQARALALAKGLIDEPNSRSSHSLPTPRGGGVAIVSVTTIGILFLFLAGQIDIRLTSALIVGGLAIAVIGFLDDMGLTSVGLRLVVHLAAATFSIYVLGGVPRVQVGEELLDFGLLGDITGIIAITWTLNLFNFMDGIDGLAASEASFVLLAGGSLAYISGSQDVAQSSVVIAMSCLGFVTWNWPPAKIFMGDVGSGYLGYLLASVAMYEGHHSPIALFIWLILAGVFFTDATVTLTMRFFGGEKIYQPHRSHAYQRLSRRWNSHRRVTLFALAINVFWLLPMAVLCFLSPKSAWWIIIVALIPIVLFVFAAGAGRRD